MTDENKLVFTKVASVSLVSLTLAIISFVAIVLIVRWEDTMDQIDELNELMLEECPEGDLLICVESADGKYVGEYYIIYLEDEAFSELLGAGALFAAIVFLTIVDGLLAYDLQQSTGKKEEWE
jgi:hypothetical protein